MHRLLLLILLPGLLLAGCRDSGGPPGAGPNGTPRVVALSPAVAQILRDLDLGGTIVGRHAFDNFTDSRLPDCGDQRGLRYEAILAVEPTHIIHELTDPPQRLLTLAEERGWTLLRAQTLTLDDVESTARVLHEALGDGVYPLEGKFDEALAPRAALDVDRVGRVLLLMSVDPPAALGPGSVHHDILVRLGAAPAIETGEPYVPMSVEDVLALAPDSILIFGPRPPNAAKQAASFEPGAALGRLGDLPIPAVESGRIALIDHPLGLIPATSLLEVADQMAQALARP